MRCWYQWQWWEWQWIEKTMISWCCKKSLQTWCHRRPAETPTRLCVTGIRVEEDLHGVSVGHHDWRKEVSWRRGRNWGVAAALVHQGFPVPVFDLDMVACAVVTEPNSKVGELKPQYLTNLYLYRLCLLKVGRVEFGIVWRGDNTCGWLAVYRVDFKNWIKLFYIFSPLLTLAATAFCWAKHRVFWLPESWSTGRVRSTGHVDVTLATATVASESMVIDVVLVVAVQGSREIAGLPRSGRHWGRAKRPWGRGKSLLNSQRWPTGRRYCWAEMDLGESPMHICFVYGYMGIWFCLYDYSWEKRVDANSFTFCWLFRLRHDFALHQFSHCLIFCLLSRYSSSSFRAICEWY